MTSPVDTSVKYFASTMTGAPVLSGTAGTLIALLDACLKDGFDTKTLTSLVAAGGVMTATFTGTHSSAADSVVLIAGVTGGPTGFAGANGEQKITARPLATTATWATTLPDGTYTGTITMKMAPAGWLKPFSGTNTAAYQSSDPVSTKCFLRVDDTAATFARVVGYELMSDINTGTGPFPTPAQLSGGGYWAKSTAANTAAVSWLLVADGRLFYLCVLPGTSVSAAQQLGVVRHFGDLTPLRLSGDAYSASLNYSITSTVTAMGEGCINASNIYQTAMPKAYTGLGSSVLGAPFHWGSATATLSYSGLTSTHGVFPNMVDGGLYLLRKIWVQTGTTNPRAEYPGVFHIPQYGVWASIRQGDRVPGAGVMTGRNLVAAHGNAGVSFSTVADINNTPVGLFDITGPWR